MLLILPIIAALDPHQLPRFAQAAHPSATPPRYIIKYLFLSKLTFLKKFKNFYKNLNFTQNQQIWPKSIFLAKNRNFQIFWSIFKFCHKKFSLKYNFLFLQSYLFSFNFDVKLKYVIKLDLYN